MKRQLKDGEIVRLVSADIGTRAVLHGKQPASLMAYAREVIHLQLLDHILGMLRLNVMFAYDKQFAMHIVVQLVHEIVRKPIVTCVTLGLLAIVDGSGRHVISEQRIGIGNHLELVVQSFQHGNSGYMLTHFFCKRVIPLTYFDTYVVQRMHKIIRILVFLFGIVQRGYFLFELRKLGFDRSHGLSIVKDGLAVRSDCKLADVEVQRNAVIVAAHHVITITVQSQCIIVDRICDRTQFDTQATVIHA